jgi:hypothetical protein
MKNKIAILEVKTGALVKTVGSMRAAYNYCMKQEHPYNFTWKEIV